jgi:hypothetical protein
MIKFYTDITQSSRKAALKEGEKKNEYNVLNVPTTSMFLTKVDILFIKPTFPIGNMEFDLETAEETSKRTGSVKKP